MATVRNMAVAVVALGLALTGCQSSGSGQTTSDGGTIGQTVGSVAGQEVGGKYGWAGSQLGGLFGKRAGEAAGSHVEKKPEAVAPVPVVK